MTPDGDVLLSWSNAVQNDSITGYQILRGPKADSLVIIEDDTGSSSTSYINTGTASGPDPHLRRESPQHIGAEPPVEHAHRDRASGRSGRGAGHSKT